MLLPSFIGLNIEAFMMNEANNLNMDKSELSVNNSVYYNKEEKADAAK